MEGEYACNAQWQSITEKIKRLKKCGANLDMGGLVGGCVAAAVVMMDVVVVIVVAVVVVVVTVVVVVMTVVVTVVVVVVCRVHTHLCHAVNELVLPCFLSKSNRVVVAARL
jgi:hypothetical protein